MFNQQIDDFDKYVKDLLSGTHLNQLDQNNLQEEMKQHLYDHYNNLISKNVSHDEAIKSTIEQFGNVTQIRKQVNRTFSNTIIEEIMKEIFIFGIMIFSFVLGPIIFKISVNISFPQAIFASLLTLLIAIPFQHLILKRQKYLFFSIIVVIVIYFVYWSWYVGLSSNIDNNILKYSISFIFSIDLTTLVNSSGLLNPPTVNMFWIIILLVQLSKVDYDDKYWKKMINVSFQYWSMLSLGVIVSTNIQNSSMQIIFMNAFLAYAFLEQIIKIRWILKFNLRKFKLN